MRSSTRNTLVFIAVCVAMLLVWIFHPRPEPSQIAIADQLNSAVDGANAHSAGRVAAIISNDYSDSSNLSATTLRVLLARGLGNADDATTSMTTPAISVQGNAATSDSTVTVTGKGGQSYFNRQVHLTWREENGKAWLVFPIPVWRVVRADYGDALDFGQ